jgi:serine/threonine protein kinase
MNNETKKTIRDDGSITPSGVSPSGTGTQKDTQPVISSGIAPGTPPSQIISSGMSTPGSKIVLNDENYKILKVIAKSTGEAEIYLAEKENQKCVFKYYYPNFKPKDSLLKQLKGLHHDDIVGLIDYGYYKDRFFEILEYAEGGSLMEIQEEGKYKYIPLKDINRIRQIVKEIINALHWCHSKGIIHRDLKPENIFFKNPDGTDVLIGDFGISSMLDEGLSKHMTGQARTEIYAAPELYQGIGGKTIISKEVDYYALGITLIFVWQAKDPFEELNPHAIMRIKLEGKVYIPEEIAEELKNLIKGLITVEPSKRWGYEEVQKWLKGEYVPVYYKIVETKYPDFHFGVIGGEDIVINDPVELAKLLEKYPEQGKKHLYKATIQRWVENANQSLYVEIRGIVEDDYPQDQDAGLIKAIYILDPMKNYKTFAEVECSTAAEEIGDAIERESSYYKSLLTQKKNADLFLFLEARGSKRETDTFRKYAQTFNPERAFNTIVLELQGKDKFKIDNLVFYKPEDLLSADDKIKNKLANLLINLDSKLSIWLEQFLRQYLKSNINKWRDLGRHNVITLVYALDEKSPFAALDEKVYNLDEFKTFFAKHIIDKDLISEMTTPNSVFVVEADFWLENYQDSSYLKVLKEYLQKNIDKINKAVGTKLCAYIIDMKLDVDDYWDNIKPLVDKAYSKGIISEDIIQKQKKFIIKEYESRTKPSDYGKKKKIIENLRIMEPSHKLIKRFEKEEKLFDSLKKSRLKEIEGEKESSITEVKRDIYQKVQNRKMNEMKNYDAVSNKGNLGCSAAIIGAVLGAIIVVGDRFGGFVLFLIFGYVAGRIFSFIAKETGRNNAVNMVTITSAEEKDRDERIENIEEDIQNKIANLDDKIRGELHIWADE